MGMTYKLEEIKQMLEQIKRKTVKHSIQVVYLRHTVDSSVSAVGPAPLLLCLVDLDVRYVERINVQTLRLEE